VRDGLTRAPYLPRVSWTHANGVLWKHFRPWQVARHNATHRFARDGSGSWRAVVSNFTIAEERQFVADSSMPLSTPDGVQSLADLEALMVTALCEDSPQTSLCSAPPIALVAPPRAYIVCIRHPAAWLASIHRKCPDCPQPSRGMKRLQVRTRPDFFIRTWNGFARTWLNIAARSRDTQGDDRVVFVRNEDIVQECSSTVRKLAEMIGLAHRTSNLSATIAAAQCQLDNQGPRSVFMSEPRADSATASVVETGVAELAQTAPNILRTLRADLEPFAMEGYGYSHSKMVGYIDAALAVAGSLWQEYEQAWQMEEDHPPRKWSRNLGLPKHAPECDVWSESTLHAIAPWRIEPHVLGVSSEAVAAWADARALATWKHQARIQCAAHGGHLTLQHNYTALALHLNRRRSPSHMGVYMTVDEQREAVAEAAFHESLMEAETQDLAPPRAPFPLAPQSKREGVAIAALVRNGCKSFTCSSRMIEELVQNC